MSYMTVLEYTASFACFCFSVPAFTPMSEVISPVMSTDSACMVIG